MKTQKTSGSAVLNVASGSRPAPRYLILKTGTESYFCGERSRQPNGQRETYWTSLPNEALSFAHMTPAALLIITARLTGCVVVLA